jgi:hypothetical protein
MESLHGSRAGPVEKGDIDRKPDACVWVTSNGLVKQMLTSPFLIFYLDTI